MTLSDNHVHTCFSTDSSTSMESQLQRARAVGLSSLCFTDHIDFEFPEAGQFLFDAEEYFAATGELQKKYSDFPLRTGVELGLKKEVLPQCLSLTASHPFDFVIGSTHLVDNMDIYYQEYWNGYGETDGIAHYYETTLNNIETGFDFDVYGHLDYVIRYCPSVRAARQENVMKEDFPHTYFRKNRDVIAEILRLLIEQGRGIELNTAGFKYGLGHPNPHEEILSLYRDLGGEILSIGSDAHEENHLAYDFDRVPKILAECGFSHYTEFQRRKPVPIKIA